LASFNHIGGSEPSTLTFKAATVTQTRNSSVMHQELISLADPDSSLAVAAVLAGNPASTAWGLVVRGAGPFATTGDSTCVQGTNPWTIAGNSTIVIAAGHLSSAAAAANSSALNVRVVGGASSAADFPVRAVLSSTGADNPVSVTAFPANSSLIQLNAIAAGYVSTAAPAAGSSGLNVWVVGGNGVSTTVTVAAFPANSSQVEVRAMPANSSLVQLNAITAGYVSTAAPAANSSGLNVWIVGGNGLSTTVSVAALPANSSQVEVRNSPTVVIGTNLQSSVTPSSGSSALMVRQVWDVKVNAASTSAFATSTQFTIAASTAQQKYVTAYSITSTDLTASVVRFMGGSTLAWAIRCQAVSSAITGANMAVGEGYIFKTDAASSLTLNISGSSRAGWTVAVSYFLAP
jgi:hypothetical protein